MQKLFIRTGFMYKIMHESCFYGIIKKLCGLDIRWRILTIKYKL